MVLDTVCGILFSGLIWRVFNEPMKVKIMLRPALILDRLFILQLLLLCAITGLNPVLGVYNLITVGVLVLYAYYIHQHKYHRAITPKQNDARILLLVVTGLCLASTLLSLLMTFVEV